MTRPQVHSKVVEILVETFQLEPDVLVPEARLYEDLDLDSIDALDLVVELQDLIGRRVDEQQLRGLRTVGDVVELVEHSLAGAAAPCG